MPRPSGETPLVNTIFEVKLLPRGSRNPGAINITTAAAVTEGATTLQLASTVASTQLYAGNSLSFNVATPTGTTRRKQIVIAEDTIVGTTATPVPIIPARDAIASAEVARHIPNFFSVSGLQDFGFTANDTTVDTTGTDSGIGTEMAIIRSGLEFSISLIERVADRALVDVVKRVGLEFAFKGREVYGRITYPDGEQHEGAGKIMNPNQPGNQNETKKFTFTFQIQGESYIYTPAYTFA